ncbi:MAG: hypothetical protein II885_07220 [Oscillospiraceae bacterium]|nr:hypothetical protein [Oscillospiraceae bacterium]
MELKFEEAFLCTEDRNVTISELSQMFDENKKAFDKDIRNNLLCPQCRIAKLVFVNGIGKHLRTHQNAVHADNCDLEQEVISSRYTDEYVKSGKNMTSIIRQIEAVQRLLREDFSQRGPDSERIQKTELNRHCYRKDIASKRIRSLRLGRKRLDHDLQDEDYGVYKIFYGKVVFQWEALEDERKRILLRDIKTNKFLCRISVTQSVFSHVPPEWVSLAPVMVDIAVMGKMEKGNNARWSHLRLEHSDYLSVYRLTAAH